MNEINITIPTTLNDITLGNYQRLQKMYSDLQLTENEQALKTISILCEVDEPTVRRMNKATIDELTVTLSNALTSKTKWVQRFFIGEQEYGFLPNIDDMTFGEYIDLDTYLKEPDGLHKVMSVLFRKIKYENRGRYDIYEYTGEEDSEIMKEMPMGIANETMVFFYRLGNVLLNHIPVFLEQEVKKAIASKQISEESGAGIHQYTELLKVTLEDLMKQPNTIYTKL